MEDGISKWTEKFSVLSLFFWLYDIPHRLDFQNFVFLLRYMIEIEWLAIEFEIED